MNLFKSVVTYILLAVLLGACNSSNAVQQNNSNGYPNAGILVDAQWVQDNLDREDLRIVDMRNEGYEEGHIPGALSVEGAGALVARGHEVENYLMSANEFADLMGGLGIGNDHTVVIYDEGNSLAAARLFYALELYGHQKAKILNGGFASWKAFNGEVSEVATTLEPATYKAETRDGLVCDIGYVLQNIGNENVVFYDARSREEYEGTDARAARAGHIPGAVHLEWSESIQDGDIPYFKSAEEIRAMLEEKGITPEKEIIPHCQSNVRGAHVYFTLRLMGYDSVRPYEGSWAEYGNTEGAPIETKR